MKKLFLTLLIVCATQTYARADEIALWNFNDAVSSTANLFAVDRVAAGHTATMTSDFAAANITNFAGTTLNAQMGDPAGQSLGLQGGTGNANNTRTLTWYVSTVGFSDVHVSFASQRTSTGFNSNQVQYSLDGINFFNFGVAYDPTTSFALQSFDLSAITGLNDNAQAAFRLIFNGSTSSTSNNRIDNLLVSGTPIASTSMPEPSTYVLLGTGLTGFLRRRRQRAAGCLAGNIRG